jgi:hypothetical protein
VLQSDFNAAAAAVRESAGGLPEAESLIQTIRQAEERRADDALELAELLAPLLARRLQRGGIEPPPRRLPTSAPPAAARPPRPAAPRGIADFIDEMIAQDHPV